MRKLVAISLLDELEADLFYGILAILVGFQSLSSSLSSLVSLLVTSFLMIFFLGGCCYFYGYSILSVYYFPINSIINYNLNKCLYIILICADLWMSEQSNQSGNHADHPRDPDHPIQSDQPYEPRPDIDQQNNAQLEQQNVGQPKQEQQNAGEPKQDQQNVEQNNQVQEYLEVNNKKSEEVMGNQQQFLKIFQQINKKQQNMKQEALKFEKKKSIKKRHSEVKENKPHSEDTKKEQILKKIDPIMKKYKNMHCPSFCDTEVAKLRFEGKEKIFKFVLYLVEELKDIGDENLSEQEVKLKNMDGPDLVKLAKTISIEIDVQFLSRLNSGNKQIACKKYRSHWRNLTSNIQDDTNIELRRKIATRNWDAKKLVNLDQMDFYSAEKREIIYQKNKRLMNEATIEDKNFNIQSQENLINYQEKPQWVNSDNNNNKTKNSKATYRHVDEGTLAMIRDLISQEHIHKMKKLLMEDLKGEAKERLVSSIERVFENKIPDQ